MPSCTFAFFNARSTFAGISIRSPAIDGLRQIGILDNSKTCICIVHTYPMCVHGYTCVPVENDIKNII